jgi:hypothetical protein
VHVCFSWVGGLENKHAIEYVGSFSRMVEAGGEQWVGSPPRQGLDEAEG